MDFSDKTIAITGGSGYIGSAIIEKLRGKANKIICISRNQKLDLDGVTVLNLDLNQNLKKNVTKYFFFLLSMTHNY